MAQKKILNRIGAIGHPCLNPFFTSNFSEIGNNTSASVLFNYGHYTSMIEGIVYLPCSHYSCIIDDGSNGTMYLKKR